MRSKSLQDKGPLLSGIHATVEEAGGNGQPGGGTQIILIINRRSFEDGACRADETILVWIVDLPFVIVTKDELVLPPIGRFPIKVRCDEPFSVRKLSKGFGSKMVFGLPVSLTE